MRPRWQAGPLSITLVRHAESVGNTADARAHERGDEVLDLHERDADVALSETGRRQADALAGWLAKCEPSLRPSMVVSSPYRRAAETARRAFPGAGMHVQLDERLRERDLGLFNGLTGRGIRARHPEEAERRSKLGKFYYQPPSGESWVDVVLRVRSFLKDLESGYDGERVWVFTHQAVIMAHRYALEDLDEAEVLEISRDQALPNGSMTVYERAGDRFELRRFADAAAVEDSETPVTHEPPQQEETPHDG